MLRAGGLLVVTSAVIFVVTAALPGDALQIRSSGRATPEQLAQLRAAAGLDRPLLVRYVDWLAGMMTGDPGRSLVTGRPVLDLLGERAMVTVTLAAAALVVAVPLMVGLAWSAARGPRAWRPVITSVVVGGAAVPQVVVAAGLAALLSTAWGLVPPVSLFPAQTAPWQRPDLLILPTLTLALPTAAYGAGLLRGAIVDASARPFVRDAVLRGLPRAHVLLRYVLPLVAPLAVRMLAVVTGALVAGATVAETLFGVTGLGSLLVAAIGARDVPVVQAVALLAAAVVVVGLLLADLTAVAVDPRALDPRRRPGGPAGPAARSAETR